MSLNKLPKSYLKSRTYGTLLSLLSVNIISYIYMTEKSQINKMQKKLHDYSNKAEQQPETLIKNNLF